jgi:cell division protein FtsB
MANDFINKVKKNRKRIIAIAIVCVALYFLIFSGYGVIKRVEVTKQSNELVRQIAIEKAFRDSVLILIDKMKFDTTEIERIARDEFGMTRKGERVAVVLPREISK